MRKTYLFLLMSLFLINSEFIYGASGITLKFNRSSTNASDVVVNISDENGAALNGVTAKLTSSHDLKATQGAVTTEIVCPNANANTSPQIKLTVSLSGIPQDFSFDRINLDIHALNGASNYQENSDNVQRLWNISIKQGATDGSLTDFGSLNDIDIAAGVGTTGNVHQLWEAPGSEKVTCNDSMTLELTITKGSTNLGCFFGLSQIILSSGSTSPTPEPEPEPEPDIDDSKAKIYNIVWKNTGTNYITEGSDGYMTVANYDVTKAQFWKFIPTGKDNCFYIQNTATGNYIGSCNLTPSSSSRVTTQKKPVEYYVAATSITNSETTGCHYLSSTDCDNYSNENSSPRALNKDGASSYIITWQAGTGRVGSYWKLIETTDLYEVRPYEPSSTLGTIAASYNIESKNGQSVTLNENSVTLQEYDMFNAGQEWYFVGTDNAGGYQIASSSSPAIVIGLNESGVIAEQGLSDKWKVNISQDNPGYYYFTKHNDEKNTVLSIDGDTLFKFNKLRSNYSRNMQIYNNPCGIAGNNYITKATINGNNIIETFVYESQAKPSNWHIVYPHDKAVVAKSTDFELAITLSQNAANDMTAYAFFDWDCNGVFETSQQLNISGTNCTATIAAPEWAKEKQSRMRIRLNSNGLDLAEDDVEGFIYDFIIKVEEAQEKCTVTVGTNSWKRGYATLSQNEESYEYGTQLTATATTIGNSSFICWREGNTIVSTDEVYTFTANHNTALIAYFSPNTNEESLVGIEEITSELNINIDQEENHITATGKCDITGMQLYNADAILVAKCNSNTIDTINIPNGIYILRIVTAEGYKNIKLYIKK